jgi:hypothetical protein
VSDPHLTETRALNVADMRALMEAERSGFPFVHWRADGVQRIVPLPSDADRLTVGRRLDSGIALPADAEVSRVHALLERVGGEWTLVDDGLSTNGSFVNGNRVVTRQRLHDHDRLCFGQTLLVYREPSSREGSESTARVPSQAAVPLTPIQRKVLIALCRPVNASGFATPATNKQIADEVHLSVDAVKAHLRVLFDRFGLGDLPQNEKRARLAARALVDGVLRQQDF